MGSGSTPMTYEEHLDEVTTLITEKYDVADDDDPSICTLDRAHRDAKAVFSNYK
jgi:hypothetical protein